jgi:hypothetical protein
MDAHVGIRGITVRAGRCWWRNCRDTAARHTAFTSSTNPCGTRGASDPRPGPLDNDVPSKQDAGELAAIVTDAYSMHDQFLGAIRDAIVWLHTARRGLLTLTPNPVEVTIEVVRIGRQHGESSRSNVCAVQIRRGRGNAHLRIGRITVEGLWRVSDDVWLR